MKAKYTTYRFFLMFLPILFIFSLQPWALCQTQTASLEKKLGKWNNDIVLLGAFATEEEPEENPCPDNGVPLKLTYSTDDNFHIGIIVQNNTDKKHKATVRFKLFGKKRKGRDRLKDIKIGTGTNYLSISDSLSRPGNYRYIIKLHVGSLQIKRKTKIFLKVNDKDTDVCEGEPTPTLSPSPTASPISIPTVAATPTPVPTVSPIVTPTATATVTPISTVTPSATSTP